MPRSVVGIALAVFTLVLALGSGTAPAQVSTQRTAQQAPLTLPLALPHRAAIDSYVASEYRAGSAQFHHFLSPAQFRAKFGAPAAQIKAAENKLAQLGYNGHVSANGLYLTASPEPSAMRSARMRGAAVAAPASTSTLRSRLGKLVTGVVDTSKYRHHPDFTQKAPTGVSGGATPCPQASQSNLGTAGYTAPAFANAYDFNGLYAKGLHGEGMSAALMEFGDYHDSNVTGLERCYGLHTPVSRVPVDGGSGGPPSGSEPEDMLDLSVLMPMLPKLKHVYVYEAPNTGNGELGAYSAFVSQDRAPVLSVSWGECEQQLSQSYEQLLGEITEQAAAQGQQIMVASGDTGALGCSGSGRPQADSISSESEAAPPWITGVGGTDLSQASTTPGSKVHREVAWNDGSGSGAGGQSVAWAMPAWQRQYLKASKVAPKGAADPCHVSRALGCRMEPDIALDADGEEGGAEAAQMLAPPGPNPPDFRNVHDVGSPGYADYCATPNCGGSGWEPVGGTSAAAPLAASAAVLWDQEARSQGLKSIGFLNPALYQLASDPSTYARDFHDVTAGSNNVHYDTKDCPRGCNPHGLYQAGRGYDMATGLGSFDVTALGNDLVKNARGLDLSPNTQTLYGYSNGGPATSRAVSVTGGSAGAGYSAHSDAKWLQVRGGKVDGRLHWRADPRGLKPGNYTGHISVKSGASSATLTVHYQVTPKARISLLSHSLHFAEKAIGGKTCTPVWGDELQSTSKSMITIAQKSGRPSKQALLAMTRQALRVANRGARGSVLHLAIDQISQGWLVNDEAPPHKKRQDVPGQPLVPSVVSVPGGGQASVPLASVANGNLEVEEAPMPPGTYTAKLRVRDLANPSSVAYVKATLVLGNGKGTPEIGSAPLKLAARADTTRHSQLVLTDPHASCAYQFSAAGNAGWVTVGNSLTDGTVGVHSHVRVPISINTRGMKPGVHHSSITVQSVNAGNGGVRVPVSVRVLPAKR